MGHESNAHSGKNCRTKHPSLTSAATVIRSTQLRLPRAAHIRHNCHLGMRRKATQYSKSAVKTETQGVECDANAHVVLTACSYRVSNSSISWDCALDSFIKGCNTWSSFSTLSCQLSTSANAVERVFHTSVRICAMQFMYVGLYLCRTRCPGFETSP